MFCPRPRGKTTVAGYKLARCRTVTSVILGEGERPETGRRYSPHRSATQAWQVNLTRGPCFSRRTDPIIPQAFLILLFPPDAATESDKWWTGGDRKQVRTKKRLFYGKKEPKTKTDEHLFRASEPNYRYTKLTHKHRNTMCVMFLTDACCQS